MTIFIASQSIEINASRAKVWDALTNPEIIKQYLFGTNAVSNWKVGSTLSYHGEWEGKKYLDHGTILQSEPEKILQSTYFSSMSGLEDCPENYSVVTYTLTDVDAGTKLTITQSNCKTEESKAHSEKNWAVVLKTMKEILERS